MTATTVTESVLFTEAITAISWERFERTNYVYPLLVNMMPTEKISETFGIYTGLNVFEQVTETQTSPEDAPVQQFTKAFTVSEFRKSTAMSRLMITTQQWNFFQQLGTYYGEAASDTFDVNTSALWNGAFTTTTAADGLSLCNSAHLNKDGANSQDNSITDVLGVEGVRVATKSFDDLKDSRGNPMHGVTLDRLLVPTALREAGMEIARSADRPDKAERATNIYSGEFEVITWNRLTTSSTAWFALNDNLLMQNSLMLILAPPEFKGWGNPDNDARYYGGYFAKSQGFLDWRGVVGSTGAG
jgi:hypothetical protein